VIHIIGQFDESFRPCKLTRHVYAYFRPKGQHDLLFSRNLDYKLFGVLATHAVGKPILVFCATRKGVWDLTLFGSYVRRMISADSFWCRTRCVGNCPAISERVCGIIGEADEFALGAAYEVSRLSFIYCQWLQLWLIPGSTTFSTTKNCMVCLFAYVPSQLCLTSTKNWRLLELVYIMPGWAWATDMP